VAIAKRENHRMHSRDLNPISSREHYRSPPQVILVLSDLGESVEGRNYIVSVSRGT